MKRCARHFVMVLAAALAAAVPAFSQPPLTRPAGLRVRPRLASAAPLASLAPAATPAPIGATHTVVGTIAKISGPILLVATRNRRLLRVDATPALANGSYSAPLFLGKIVLIEGRYARDGTLFAATITRLPRVDTTIPDR